MQLFLSKEEKFHAESIATKRENLRLQDKMLQQELDALIIDFSKRNSVDFKKAKIVDVEKGFVEYEDEMKPVKEPKQTAGKKK